MKKFLTLIAATAMALSASAQESVKVECTADEIITLWDNDTAPHSSCDSAPEAIVKRGSGYKCSHTHETVFYLFKAKNPTGHAMAYFPGGGYKTVNLNFGMAEWLRERGITTLVVKYRLPNQHREVPLEDARAAIAYLRENAERLGIDPQKSTLLELLGTWRTAEDIAAHSADLLVTGSTPPALLFHSEDDPLAPVTNSTLYYKALKHYGVKATMHLFPSGGHGWIGRETWQYRKTWLEATKEWILAL